MTKQLTLALVGCLFLGCGMVTALDTTRWTQLPLPVFLLTMGCLLIGVALSL